MPPVATIGRTSREVPFVPTAEVAVSFDHHVGEEEHGLRDAQPERLRGLEADYEFEFGRLLDRQIARVCTLQDAIDVTCRLAELFRQIGTVGNEAA
jgi:hypothetical protein